MEEKNINEDDTKNAEKIQALRDMISTAENTLQGAKSMLLQLEGKKKVGRRRKTEDSDDVKIIEGTFDGQIMLGTDGKQYPVPANYASKSKLIKGDMLKLSITSDGSFIYKQIGPVTRKMAIGTVNQDTDGNYFVVAEGKAYRVLLASITYFKVEPGDEVTIVTPRDLDSEWGAIENLLQKSREKELFKKETGFDMGGFKKIDDIFNKQPTSVDISSPTIPTTSKIEADSISNTPSASDEWLPNLDDLRKELENNSNE